MNFPQRQALCRLVAEELERKGFKLGPQQSHFALTNGHVKIRISSSREGILVTLEPDAASPDAARMNSHLGLVQELFDQAFNAVAMRAAKMEVQVHRLRDPA